MTAVQMPITSTIEEYPSIISTVDLQQGYGKRTVFHHLDLSLGAGVNALVGPNGAGKTTLLKTMATLLRPKSGHVLINENPMDNRPTLAAARRRIGYLPQDFGCDPRFTVRDYVTYIGWLREIPKAKLDPAVDAAIEAVNLASLRHRRFKALSGGMRQRLGIAGAIVGAPDVIILDEPTVGLDPEQRLEFRSILRSLSKACIVLSTHLIEDVLATADRVIVLGEGAVRFDGTVTTLLARNGDSTKVDNGTMGMAERAYLSALHS